MDIERLIAPLSKYLPQDILLDKVGHALKLLPEELEHILPTVVLGNDGLNLASLILCTRSYLTELHMREVQKQFHIDFVSADSVFNYRIKTWQHQIKEEERVTATFDLAEVELLHGPVAGFKTILSFAASQAEERDAWLLGVLQAIPISKVLRFSK